MADPVYVTSVAERKPQYNGIGTTVAIPLWEDNGADVWWEQFGDKTSFTFRSRCFFGKEGEQLFYQLMRAVKKRDVQSVREVLPRMKRYCQPNYEDLNPVEKWASMAVQIPGDIGGPRKQEIKELLTERVSGRVLETMCGFNSYFGESPNISEVVVLDYCRAMLERYPYPERQRILYDLEQIVKGEKLYFFHDESFETVGCWGSNYLSEPVPVFSEFHRILSKGGKLFILESTSEGYQDLIKGLFNPEQCSRFMREAGFSTSVEHLDWLKTEWEIGDYYLVEGRK